MATITSNDLIEGISGKFGNTMVFRTMRGKTFVSPVPRKPNKKKESAAQRNTRTTFQKAAEWAQIILLDPERKTYYQQRAKALNLPNAYTAAITDYMRKAKVDKVQWGDTTQYTISKPGFAVNEVKVHPAETTEEAKVSVLQDKDTWIVRHTTHNTARGLELTIIDHARHEMHYNTGKHSELDWALPGYMRITPG